MHTFSYLLNIHTYMCVRICVRAQTSDGYVLIKAAVVAAKLPLQIAVVDTA